MRIGYYDSKEHGFTQFHFAYFQFFLDKLHICIIIIVQVSYAEVNGLKFCEKVRAARVAAGLSQNRLAEMTGISLRTIQNYESGERLPKQRDTYLYLSQALNIDQGVLLDDNAEFILKAESEYGSKAGAQARQLVEEISGLYSGGELAEEDMDAMMKAIQDAYWIAKQNNRKYAGKKQ